MFTFVSPVFSKNIWKLCFRDKKEMLNIFYDGDIPEENKKDRVLGITDYVNTTVYIDKQLDEFLLAKTLRHELMHIYLWETGQQARDYTEEDICDIASVAIPTINKSANNIMTRLNEGLYKNKERL